MIWPLSCLLLAAVAIWHARGAPLIEDATFSDIDLVAEDSQPNAVYVAAPARVKRTPQYFGGNCGFNGCGNFGANNNYAYRQEQPFATVVRHKHLRDGPRPSAPTVVISHQHQPSAANVVHREHYRNRPSSPPPSPQFTDYDDYDTNDYSSGFHSPPPPPGPGFNGGNPFDYYSGPPYGGMACVNMNSIIFLFYIFCAKFYLSSPAPTGFYGNPYKFHEIF
ncbi:unnamed protein product [Ceratitis capitata]|uniref:(Mediterranean fruit fly) hypothetical protein n=1 Tax=Ceratitis capitata TaxID=7213 RepID=A0A811U1H3_CERCA|nr:unnamed protein product [Ceratitis capitata]